MPRMSKKRKQEWALFLNDRNRITYNELCRKCRNDCKQSFRCIVVLCPKYLRFLYKGIIIKHNKTEPTYTKTSLFLCEKRRFFMARTEKGVVTTI